MKPFRQDAVPARTARRVARGVGVVLVPLAAGACASTMPPPPAVIEVPPPRLTSPSTPSIRAPSFAPVPAISAPALWLPASTDWEPRRPIQSGVSAIQIRVPGGGGPDAVARAWAAGRTLALERTAAGWRGLAGLPIDSAGVFDLRVEVGQGPFVQRDTFAITVEPRTYASSRLSVAPRGESRPETQRRIASERERIRAVLEAPAGPWLADGPFEWPRPPQTTSPYGQRRVFNGQTRSRHMGLDIRGRSGQPVQAPAAGRVVLVGDDFFYQGNAVYLDHGLGLVTAYFHLSSVAVRTGELVAQGDLLGAVGSTGRSTAPHLHWSAYVGGMNVDPQSLIGLSFSHGDT